MTQDERELRLPAAARDRLKARRSEVARNMMDRVTSRLQRELSEANGGLLGSTQSWTNGGANMSATAAANLDEAIAAIDRCLSKREEHERTVYVFKGTLEQFKAEMREQGVSIVDRGEDGHILSGFGPDLAVVAIGSVVLIGDRDRINAFLAPSRPLARHPFTFLD